MTSTEIDDDDTNQPFIEISFFLWKIIQYIK